MDEVKVSIYCLAYNHEKYIRQTLDSFVMQKTNFRYEIIIHDDASTDHTQSIIKEYAAEYPNLFVPILQQKNVMSTGVSIFEKYVLPKVRGKYIASCEGDDFWIEENRLQKMYDALEKHPECSFAANKVIACKEDGRPDERTWPPQKYNFSTEKIISSTELMNYLMLKKSNMFHTCGLMYRTSLYDYADTWGWRKRDIFSLLFFATKGDLYYFSDPMSCRRIGTIGNWNSRMNSRGMSAWYEMYLVDFEQYRKFNQATGDEYGSLIAAKLIKMSIEWMPYQPFEIRKKIMASGVKFKDARKILTIKNKILYGTAYYLMLFCPIMYKLRKVKNPVQK